MPSSCCAPRPGHGTDLTVRIVTVITVLVVDDHDLLREGVSSCLSAFDDLEVVGESASGEEGLEAASRLRPDVVVIDLIMPGIGGVEAIRRLRDADESIGLLALSTFAHGDLIREAIDAGASGYLVKSVDTEGLAQAVRDVAAGRGSFSRDVTRVLAAASDRSAVDVDGAVHRAGGRGRRTRRPTGAATPTSPRPSTSACSRSRITSAAFSMKLQAQSRTEATAIILRSR